MHQKVLSLLMAVAMLFSFATPAFASEPPTAPPIVTEQTQGKHLHEETPPAGEHQTEEKTPEETPPAIGEATEPPAEDHAPIQPEKSTTTEPDTAPPTEIVPEGDPALGESTQPPIVDSGIPPGISDVELLPELPEEIPEYTVVELRNGESIVIMGTFDSGSISSRIIGRRLCVFQDCTNYVTVTTKYDYVCNAHKCAISGCSSPVYSQNPNRCQSHAGITRPICQIYTPGNPQNLCGKPSVSQGSITCWEHHCPGCLGIGNGNATICDFCRQCWKPGCPNPSTCTNECNAHCPHNCKTHHQTHCLTCHGKGNCCACNTCTHTCKVHHLNHCTTCHGAGNCCVCNTCAHTCKTHHQNHCTTCHVAPCVCYPLSPTISVGG